MTFIVVEMTKGFAKHLCSCISRHHDHGAKGDVVKNHSESLIAAFLGHHLGLWSELVEVMRRGKGHEHLTLFVEKTQRRLTAYTGFRLASYVDVCLASTSPSRGLVLHHQKP